MIVVPFSMGQAPYLVKDINTFNGPSSSEPQDFVVVNSHSFFSAFSPAYGRELWITDGTEAGTRMVKDIAESFVGSNPTNLTKSGDLLYFIVDGITGDELWVSDGTEKGTLLVKPDIIGFGSPLLTDANGTLFFQGKTKQETHVLYMTNGTADSTFPLKSFNGLIANLVSNKGNAFFSLRGDYYSGQLWMSDGSSVGTIRVRGVAPQISQHLKDLTSSGELLYFSISLPNYHRQLWRSDGTFSGTFELTDLNTESLLPDSLVDVNGTLYFAGFDNTHGFELWKSNGLPSNTHLIKDVSPGSTYTVFSYMDSVEDAIVFAKVNARELWKSDGTEIGTLRIKSLPFDPGNITNNNQFVIFTGRRYELWRSDLSEENTYLVKDVCPTCNSGWIEYLTNYNGNILFQGSRKGDREPWISDGTTNGTHQLANIWPATLSSQPRMFTGFNGKLFFVANSNELYRERNYRQSELWCSDGSEEGTYFIRKWPALSSWDNDLHSLININGTIYFALYGSAETGIELWKSDGSFDGTGLVKDIWPGYESSLTTPDRFVSFKSKLFFVANDGIHGRELWVSNGSTDGTYLFKDIIVGNSSNPNELTVVDNTLFFVVGHDPVFGEELWKTDGTTDGTTIVKDIIPGSEGSAPQQLINARGKLFFLTYDGFLPSGLWVSDGTNVGTKLLHDGISGFPQTYSELTLIEVEDRIYFIVKGEPYDQLWITDGTDVSTRFIKELTCHASFDDNAIAVNGILFFAVCSDRELWRSDGSVEGTYKVDLGLGDNYPYSIRKLFNAGGKLVFTVQSSNPYQSELMMTDGTPEGTIPLVDLGDTNWDNVNEMIVVCPNLYVSMNDQMHGYELWAMEMDDPDCDNVVQEIDNCPSITNPNQLDCDGDGIGNVCDVVFSGDFDGNGLIDATDVSFFIDCYNGPELDPDPDKYGCARNCLQSFDLHPDQKLDLRDFAALQIQFGNP